MIETIEWFPAAQPPDADLTVLIEVDPACDYSDPVFMGYLDGDRWRDVPGVAVDVVRWANMPKGGAAATEAPEQSDFYMDDQGFLRCAHCGQMGRGTL